MLRDIDIKDYLIDIIGNYLLKKTQKSFINFELFKEILSLLISEHSSANKTNKQINTSIFNIISYPKNSCNLIFFESPKSLSFISKFLSFLNKSIKTFFLIEFFG